MFMSAKDDSANVLSSQETDLSLKERLKEISEKCIKCPDCQKECAFLRKYGKPKEIADAYDSSKKAFRSMPFECSLCQLCSVVCPVNLNPSDMFLEMRREKMRLDAADYQEHAGMLAYERRGTSRLFTYYAIPAHCDTIFFPGCALPGTRPDKTLKLYEEMKKNLPSLGIVLDCCMKISHDLGRQTYFDAMFREMRDFLIKNGVRYVIVACPNCYSMFRMYGEGLSVRTAYEVIAEGALLQDEKITGTVTIHDPCTLRFEPAVRSAVRELVKRQGLTVEEMPHHGKNTLCCGEGGFVGCLFPDLAKNWGGIIKGETTNRKMITYCAGCTNRLDGITSTGHIVDLVFEPVATLAGEVKVSKAPMTYLNRLMLKRRIRKSFPAPITRERIFHADETSKKGGMMKRLLLIGILIALILALRFTGATRYLEQETLRQWIQGYGILAPMIYMLVYTIAPALLLPGLPITIAGGILFGPFWGVIYAISGATLGACVAFLVARYTVRDWIEKKLKSPRWQRLDESVEKHGWKVVAFTRLIPLFPFNLLNYAFGLTKIRFVPYAVTTFFCMLPACIAFIVFSSSLLDLIRGKISINFIAGIGLIVFVSLMPLFYRRYKAKRGINDPL
jgi:uncharacterized membrane protein YdjX (TVP38/TMEM64 family)/Fe-S oxidoreductase